MHNFSSLYCSVGVSVRGLIISEEKKKEKEVHLESRHNTEIAKCRQSSTKSEYKILSQQL